MKHNSDNIWLHFSAALLAVFVVAGIGAASVMILRRDCVVEGKRVQRAENKISVLKRENDYWNAEIANSKTPSKLRKRVDDGFILPSGDRMVFAFPLKDIPLNERKLLAISPRKTAAAQKTARR
ncbi:MAG: hypothetical protein J6P03_04990 [Opitutales bacterium]|nr:hypothetical protein [Opitutales bacterium]